MSEPPKKLDVWAMGWLRSHTSAALLLAQERAREGNDDVVVQAIEQILTERAERDARTTDAPKA